MPLPTIFYITHEEGTTETLRLEGIQNLCLENKLTSK